MSNQIDALPPPTGDSTAAVGTATRECPDARFEAGVADFLRHLAQAGWGLSAPLATAPPEVTVCLVARPPQPRAGTPGPHLLYVYGRETDLCVDDLWRIATDARTSGCEHAVMLLAPDAVISVPLRGAAARLRVRVLRLNA